VRVRPTAEFSVSQRCDENVTSMGSDRRADVQGSWCVPEMRCDEPIRALLAMPMAQKILETLEKSHSLCSPTPTHPHQHQAHSHACTAPSFITVALIRMMAHSGYLVAHRERPRSWGVGLGSTDKRVFQKLAVTTDFFLKSEFHPATACCRRAYDNPKSVSSRAGGAMR
jgi:hypothetical protein